ncbi:PorP/SprF family type IX secretion system membrane protein [Anaerophaga thermohalophila]|uniref:PorP/SprF family type IX secretion system membrane protein n=1 Tax=Anaerophaga thermohalophila TaxID=177400 RepID=UPI001FDF4387|nr:type IX secretion system membrane protein PorP/SprF [Anaerophaga thermohalophila]
MKISAHIKTYISFALMLVGFLFTQKTFSQQEPMYTQYMHNIITINPAYTGTRDALSMVLLSRLQWVGLDGAPRTHNFAAHTPLNDHTMGLGLSLVSDEYGPVNNLFLNFSYAYRVNITEKTILSMGLNGGLYNYHVGLSSLNVDETDPSFSKDLEQKFIPNAGFGLYLYSPKYYAGVSLPRLFQTELGNNNSPEEQMHTLKRHFFVMAGFDVNVGSQMVLKPSFITRIVEGAPFSADITARLLLRETYEAGVSYRPDESLSLLVGMHINPQLLIGYAYDFSSADMRPFNNGSHEIVVSYEFGKTTKEKVVSPRNF